MNEGSGVLNNTNPSLNNSQSASDTSKHVNYIDTIIPTVPINNVAGKRKKDNQGIPVNAPGTTTTPINERVRKTPANVVHDNIPQSSMSVPMSQHVNQPMQLSNLTHPSQQMDQPIASSSRTTNLTSDFHQIMPSNNENPPGQNNVQGTSNKPPTIVKKKAKRNPRYVTIKTSKKNIWSQLSQLNANLTYADWITMDKSCVKDIADGIRFLRSPRKTEILRKTMEIYKHTDNVAISLEPRKRNKKMNKNIPIPMQGQDNTTPMMINQVQAREIVIPNNQDINLETKEIEDDNENDWSDWDSSLSFSGSEYNEEEDSEMSDDASLATSVTPYSYDIHYLRSCAPLRAPIIIKGILVDCVFDSGASVSVVNAKLATRLGIQVTHVDEMYLTTFDETGKRNPARISVNVPINVAGHIRHEHVCIQPDNPQKEHDFFILGMTWFKQHNITIRLKDNVICIPTKSEGLVELQGNSVHDQRTNTSTIGNVSEIFMVTVNQNSVENTTSKPSEIIEVQQYSTDVLNEEVELQKLLTFDHILDPELKETLKEYEAVFVEVSGPGLVNIIEHHIPLNTEKPEPIRSRPYRLTWNEEDYLKKEIKKMLDLNLIKPSDGLWCSPCFFVKKNNGKLRLVIDYRRLNQMTVKSGYALPIIDQLLDRLGGHQYFSVIDCASGFWQIPLEESCKQYTGFVTTQGCYEFNVMPFGLTSASSTFQKMMNTLLAPYVGDFVFIFIDDVIIFSKTLNEHRKHIVLILEKCLENNLRLNLTKSHFLKEKVEYLGHEISANGIHPNTRNMEKILRFPIPKNVDEIKSFLGTTGYYRRFIPHYASVAQPLTELTRKNKNFIWGEKQISAYELLKMALVTPPILAFPNRDLVQILTTDASYKGFGAILSQSKDGTNNGERVISYISKGVSKAQENYAQVHLEAYAIVWAVNHFRHYLIGRHFILRTDCAALAFILAPSKPSAKLSRWAASLLEYDYTVIHQPGKDNPADSLSRLIPED